MKEKKQKQKKKWIRTRHKIVTMIAYCILCPYILLRYRIRVEDFPDGRKRPYLILLNHQTPFDQFFVGLSIRRALYYMATEDIFSMGWISSVIRWLVAPIPIKKQTTDVSAVMTCIRVAREGGTIVIAPEGNRTYSGRTCYMNPAIAGLAKKLKLPIALYRIEGGYGTEPRWSDCLRRGGMRGYVSRVIEPEEAAQMTNEELMEQIREGLHVDEGNDHGCFRSNKRAEYLERAIYVCPECGLTTFESQGNLFQCKTCGLTVTYGTDKTLTGVEKAFPFRFVTEWYDYQERFVNQLNPETYVAQPMYREEVRLSEVIVYKRKELLRPDAQLALYGDRIVVDEGKETEMVFPFAETRAVTVLGRNKLNIYWEDRVLQCKGSKRFNALKYVHMFHRYTNLNRGDGNGEFLGL